MELVGYVSRTLSSKKNPYAVIYFVIQYFFIVVAPVMFSVSNDNAVTFTQPANRSIGCHLHPRQHSNQPYWS